jgi:hypothetical protein
MFESMVADADQYQVRLKKLEELVEVLKTFM